jgi:hypothetical protein
MAFRAAGKAAVSRILASFLGRKGRKTLGAMGVIWVSGINESNDPTI